jgi:hypothetical protein
MKSTDAELFAQLKRRVDGLIYQSEMDARYRPFAWHIEEPLTPAVVLHKLSLSPRIPIHGLALEVFFQNAVKPIVVPGLDGARQVERSSALVTWLQEHLQNLQAFQVGQIDTEVVVVGQVSENWWLGFKIQVVEA